MNLEEACQRACQEPTLEEALTWMAVWETERVVAQALEYKRTGVSTAAHGGGWDTCFKVLFERVLIDWFHGEAPLGARPPHKGPRVTVRVIKPKPQPKLKCHGCKATLEFEFSDLIPGYFEHDWTESGPEGVGIKCPDCGTETQWKAAPDAVVESTWEKKGKRVRE